MGRVTKSRAEALLSAPAPDGLATLERWSDAVGGRLRYTEGARLVDAWLVPMDERLVALMDAPDEASFGWVVEQTAQVLGIRRQVIELRMLVSHRDRWRSPVTRPLRTRRAEFHASFGGIGST
jgi:hypothetical protein